MTTFKPGDRVQILTGETGVVSEQTIPPLGVLPTNVLVRLSTGARWVAPACLTLLEDESPYEDGLYLVVMGSGVVRMLEHRHHQWYDAKGKPWGRSLERDPEPILLTPEQAEQFYAARRRHSEASHR